MTFIVATNVVASRPPKHWSTGTLTARANLGGADRSWLQLLSEVGCKFKSSLEEPLGKCQRTPCHAEFAFSAFYHFSLRGVGGWDQSLSRNFHYFCQAQPKPASQSPAWGWHSLIISVIVYHPPRLIFFRSYRTIANSVGKVEHSRL